MKKIIFGSLLAIGTSVLFAGCGLLPAVELDDPLALDDVEMISDTLTDVSVSPIATRVAGSGNLAASATFNDIAPSTFTLVPSTFDVSVLIKKAKVSAGCAAATGVINVSISNFRVSVRDKTDRFKDFKPSATTFSFNAADGTVNGLSAEALGFSMDEIAKVVDIITTEPTPNKVDVVAKIVTDPPLKGCKVTFVFGKTKGKIKF